MDVTPQVINEVEFHQKMRGYDPDEVDDFLERVAVAVGQLQDRAREAVERAAAAERKLTDLEHQPREAPPAPKSAEISDDEAETMKRTLVLAQKTADAAVHEAQEEAKALVEQARQDAERLRTDIEQDARRDAEETKARLIAEIAEIEEARDAIRADHGILERHLDEQRLRLRSSIDELQRLLDDPGRLRVAPPPELSGVELPETMTASVPQDEPVAVADEPAPERNDSSIFGDAEVIDLEKPITGGVTFTAPEEPEPPVAPKAEFGLETEDDAWARFMEGDEGPSTESLSFDDSGDDDAYLAELRKAMLDDTSAATLDSEQQRSKARFGRRR